MLIYIIHKKRRAVVSPSFYFSLYLKALIAFKIANTATPTSANTASHNVAIPKAPNTNATPVLFYAKKIFLFTGPEERVIVRICLVIRTTMESYYNLCIKGSHKGRTFTVRYKYGWNVCSFHYIILSYVPSLQKEIHLL